MSNLMESIGMSRESVMRFVTNVAPPVPTAYNKTREMRKAAGLKVDGKPRRLPKTSKKDREEARKEFARSCEVVSSEEFQSALNAVKHKLNQKSGKL